MPNKFPRCKYCNSIVYRDTSRMNENIKRGWDTYCSQKCLGVSRRNGQTYSCSRVGCNNTFIRNPSDFKKIKKCYCSTHCAAVSNNLKKVRICQNPNCKNKFTGRKRKYCSLTCIPVRQSRYSKKMVLDNIRSFYEVYRRIPVKRELNYLYRLARNYFGTWNNAIKTAGLDPNPVMFANRHIAKDGHECDSFSEKIIDDWMFEKEIEHKRDIPYPGNKGFTCDFVIGNKWVEFFGLAGQHKKYDLLKRRKLNLVRKYGINLVKLFPDDVFPKNKLSLIL